MSDAANLEFYERFAASYHLIFADWKRSIDYQAGILHGLLQRLGFPPPCSVLDCSCGIGTQSIGLLSRGYCVLGTDISPASLRRAEEEARRNGLSLTTTAADFRSLDADVSGQFDVVIAFDNALPHLLTDDDLRLAAKNIFAKTRPGGVFAASVRNYDELSLECPRITPPVVHGVDPDRRVCFQLWDWTSDKRSYAFTQIVTLQRGQEWETLSWNGVYRALLRVDLECALTAAGFESVTWHLPTETGFYQPIVSTRRPVTPSA
jgi:glycine/sarcosine N-methyltransferase